MIWGLLHSLPIYSVEYQKTKVSEGILKAVDIGGGILTNAMDQVDQQRMNDLQQMMNQNLMNQLSPKLSDPRAYKIFPGCPRPESFPAVPMGACSNVTDQNGVMQAQFMSSLANRWIEFYEMYASTGQDTLNPVGLQCLEQATKKMKSDIQDKVNILQGLIDNIKKGQHQFADESEELKRQMKLLNLELNGGQSNDVDMVARDYSKFFPGCSGIIPQEALTGAAGLIGIKNSIEASGMRKSSQDFIANQNSYDKELDTVVERMLKDLTANGIDNWIDGGATPTKWVRGGITDFKGMENLIQEEVREFQLKRKNIENELAKFNYVPPKFDSNFNDNFNDFLEGSKNYFRQEYIQKCATSTGGEGYERGLGLSPEKIYKGLVQLNNKSGGATLGIYQKSIQDILDSNAFIDEKMARIKELDKRFGKGNIKVLYLNDKNKKSYDTVYDLLKKSVDRCQTQYVTGNVVSKNKNVIESYAKKLEKAQGSLNQLKQLHDSFTSNLASQIKNKVKYCSGSPFKEGNCTPEALSPSNDKFCISNASQCATRAIACHQQAENFIIDRKAKIKASAGIYNQKIGELVTKQEQYLNGIKAQVAADSAYLKAYFPGASFIAPPDLVVALPPPMDSPYGIPLRGGGDLGFLYNLPAQLDKLKTALSEQGEKANQEANDFLKKTEEQMKANKEKFVNLAKECTTAMSDYQKMMMEQAKQAQEANAKISGDAEEFCQKYNHLANINPAAGCDGANSPKELFGEAIKIAGALDPSVIEKLGSYEKICAQNQNEAKVGTDYNKNYYNGPPTPELLNECKAANYDWNKVMMNKENQILGSISDPKLKAKVQEFIKGEDLSVNPPVVGALGKKVALLRDLKNDIVPSKNETMRNLDTKDYDKEKEHLIKSVKELLDKSKALQENLQASEANTVKEELNVISKTISSDYEKGKKSLDEFLSKKESLMAKAKSDDAKNSVNTLFDSIKKTSDGLTKEFIKDLPDRPENGPAKMHENLFVGGKEENNVCAALKNEAVARSIEECNDDTNFKKCYNDSFDKYSKEIPIGTTLDMINSKFEALSESAQTPGLEMAWSKLGENNLGKCMAELTSTRTAKESIDPNSGSVDHWAEIFKSLGKLK